MIDSPVLANSKRRALPRLFHAIFLEIPRRRMYTFPLYFVSIIYLMRPSEGTTINWGKCRNEDQFCIGVSHHNNKTSFDGNSGCLARYDCTVFVVGNKNMTSEEVIITFAFNFVMIEDIDFKFTIIKPQNSSGLGNKTKSIGLSAKFHKESILSGYSHYITITNPNGDHILIPPSVMKLNHRFMFFKYDTGEDELKTLTDVPVELLIHLHGTSSSHNQIDVIVSEQDIVLFGKNKSIDTFVRRTHHAPLPWWSAIILLAIGLTITAFLLWLVDSFNYKSK